MRLRDRRGILGRVAVLVCPPGHINELVRQAQVIGQLVCFPGVAQTAMTIPKRNQRIFFTVVCEIHELPGRQYWPSVRRSGLRRAARHLEWKFEELATYLGDDVGRDPKAKKDKYVFTWRGFKDVKLSDAQKQAYEAWDVHDEELYELVATAVQAGYKLSTTYNSGNDTFTATFTGGQGTGAADGYSMSAFAPDWYNALRVLIFKHVELLGGDWTTAGSDESSRWG